MLDSYMQCMPYISLPDTKHPPCLTVSRTVSVVFQFEHELSKADMEVVLLLKNRQLQAARASHVRF